MDYNRFDINKLSSYFDGEMKYARDYVSGGLYGPVILSV